MKNIDNFSHIIRNSILHTKWNVSKLRKSLDELEQSICDINSAYTDLACSLNDSLVTTLLQSLSKELTKAQVDKTITTKDAMNIIRKLCGYLGIEIAESDYERIS